ncbi:unnamed protein product [Colias eurytheme]|nr:unnamed protein product [Colias eurytheme]
MSSSEPDTSELSNSGSPFSQESYSPYSYSSPQIDPLTNGLTDLTCDDGVQGNQPYLRIIEQPTDYFRFRYKSEMLGTHGCLLGKHSTPGKNRTHPTVELCNYNGSALIRCSLARHDSPNEHPHKLTEDDQDRDITSVVPQRGSYKVAFTGMGIIHTAKKEIALLLYSKYTQQKNSDFNDHKLRLKCENESKSINLNIVRLKFTAHDVQTGKLICGPVFSEPIHNIKSAATNDLKICRSSSCYGSANGGEDVFILVEKVNKKNIMVRFFELGENGERTWTANASFVQSDVHHQYAIVFRTPPYVDKKITSNVKVYFELVRPSDGKTSEPREYTYKAEFVNRQNKKRKADNSYSSINSNSGGSVKSYSDLPVTLDFFNPIPNKVENMDVSDIPRIPNYTPPTPPSSDPMADALLLNVGQSTNTQVYTSPMLGQPHVPAPPVLQFTSSEMERLLEPNTSIPSDERRRFCYETDLSEYFQSFNENLKSDHPMSFLKNSLLVEDSGVVEPQGPIEGKIKIKKEVPEAKPHENIRIKSEYSAVYTAEDGTEVKKLVKELCELIRNKALCNNKQLTEKLNRLFDMRLSNGDTFLHMTLCSNQPSLQFIVKLVHNSGLIGLLNLQNHQMRSILHLAVINDQASLIPFLVAKGCNPMLVDEDGNNVIHYAVICGTCLEPLLKAIKENDVPCDIDATNYKKQTALHLSAIYGSESSARLLLGFGAQRLRDSEGRAPLHLAARDDCVRVLRALLERAGQSEVDEVDGRGYTALQIVCEEPLRPNTLEIAKLLLEKKADPEKHEPHTRPPWKLALDKPELLELLKMYSNIHFDDLDIKSEPEDDFESPDEEESPDLSELSHYIQEVSSILDTSGAWRELAKRLQRDSLVSWYGSTASPTATLLKHIKELNDDVTSKSLALLLDDMGEREAANIIRKCINDL